MSETTKLTVKSAPPLARRYSPSRPPVYPFRRITGIQAEGCDLKRIIRGVPRDNVVEQTHGLPRIVALRLARLCEISLDKSVTADPYFVGAFLRHGLLPKVPRDSVDKRQIAYAVANDSRRMTPNSDLLARISMIEPVSKPVGGLALCTMINMGPSLEYPEEQPVHLMSLPGGVLAIGTADEAIKHFGSPHYARAAAALYGYNPSAWAVQQVRLPGFEEQAASQVQH